MWQLGQFDPMNSALPLKTDVAALLTVSNREPPTGLKPDGWGSMQVRNPQPNVVGPGSRMSCIYPPWCDYETIRRLDAIGYELIECPREEIDLEYSG
jgi:hypothetical protein